MYVRQLWEPSRGLFSCAWLAFVSRRWLQLAWWVIWTTSDGSHPLPGHILLRDISEDMNEKTQTLKHPSSFCFCSMLTNIPLAQSKPHGKTRGRVGCHCIKKGMDMLNWKMGTFFVNLLHLSDFLLFCWFCDVIMKSIVSYLPNIFAVFVGLCGWNRLALEKRGCLHWFIF